MSLFDNHGRRSPLPPTLTTHVNHPRDQTFRLPYNSALQRGLVGAGMVEGQSNSTPPDAGRRRYHSWGMDFDTRAMALNPHIEDHSDDSAKEAAIKSAAQVRQSLINEFGERGIGAKTDRFAAIGTKPFSTLSYHNAFFHQIRQSYVLGAYYPALVSSCALGERILNHLVLDLRAYFVETPEYKNVANAGSFSNWRIVIDTLEAWNVLLPDVVTEFRALSRIRHRSVHFNIRTYKTVEDEALKAVLHMRTIIERQFGSLWGAPWFIEGTIGGVFIRKEFESDPFVKTYFLPNCPFVGPLFGAGFTEHGWEFYDRRNYGTGSLTDEEFAQAYNERNPEEVVHSIPNAG